MLKCFKTKIAAVIVFAAMLTTLISPLGVFADVQISNADDYFSKLPTSTKDYRFNSAADNLADGTCTYGVGKLINNGQTDAHAYLIQISSTTNSIKFTTLGIPQNQARTYGLQLNFGMYDGTNAVETYYGTNAIYSYAVDLNMIFADTSAVSTGSGISNVNGTGVDSRCYYVLQGFGTAPIFLYQNGWKYNGSKVAEFTGLTDGKLANGKYTAVYTINMGSDITASKGSWKLLKKDDSGNVTDTIYLSQNIALSAQGKNSWDIYNTYGVIVGLNGMYTGSSIEITGARFYRETLNGDTNAAFAKLPTQSNKSAADLNSAIGMPGMIEAAIQNGNVSSTANKLTVNASYGQWAGNSHRNHFNGFWFTHDVKQINAADPGVYVYETDLVLHNLGAVETTNNTTTNYPSSVDQDNTVTGYAGPGNRMRIISGGATINIYADGLQNNDNSDYKGKLKNSLKGKNVPLKVVQVLNLKSATEASYDIYAKNGDGALEYMYSYTLKSDKFTDNIGRVGVAMCACAGDATHSPSLDIIRSQFYKVNVTDSLTFNSASYAQADGKTTVTAAYDYQKAKGANYTVIAAIYDSNENELKAAGIKTLSIGTRDYLEGTKNVEIELDYSGDMAGKNIKLFTWNSIDELKPILDAQPVSAAQ